MIDFNEVFMYSDQPVQCPYCGNRTEIIIDLSHTNEQTQIHRCLSVKWKHEFVTQTETPV